MKPADNTEILAHFVDFVKTLDESGTEQAYRPASKTNEGRFDPKLSATCINCLSLQLSAGLPLAMHLGTDAGHTPHDHYVIPIRQLSCVHPAYTPNLTVLSNSSHLFTEDISTLEAVHTTRCALHLDTI